MPIRPMAVNLAECTLQSLASMPAPGTKNEPVMNPTAYDLERNPYQAYFSMIPPCLALLYPALKFALCSQINLQGLICSDLQHTWEYRGTTLQMSAACTASGLMRFLLSNWANGQARASKKHDGG